MNTKLALVAVSTLALAACGDSGVVEDPSDPEQIAAATANLATPQAGEYRMRVELVEFELPGASQEEQETTRSFMEMMNGQEQTFCMTEEMAEEGYQEFLENLNQGMEGCEFSSFSVEGDTLDADMVCDDGAGSTGTMEFAGTISETSQDMTISMDMANEAEGQSMRMVMRNTAERVGECAS